MRVVSDLDTWLRVREILDDVSNVGSLIRNQSDKLVNLLPVEFVEPVTQLLGETDHCRDRCAQLVAHRGNELVFGLNQLFQGASGLYHLRDITGADKHTVGSELIDSTERRDRYGQMPIFARPRININLYFCKTVPAAGEPHDLTQRLLAERSLERIRSRLRSKEGDGFPVRCNNPCGPGQIWQVGAFVFRESGQASLRLG